MRFRTYGQAVLTLPERHARRRLAVRPPGNAAAPSAQARARRLGPLPAPGRQTGTFDNGTEFAHQHELPARGRETGCCDTPAPWQKGGGWKMRSGGCGAAGPVRPTGRPSRGPGLRRWCRCTIIRPASVWATGRPRKSSGTTCCTSNVNPPSRVRGNDGPLCPPLRRGTWIAASAAMTDGCYFRADDSKNICFTARSPPAIILRGEEHHALLPPRHTLDRPQAQYAG